MPTQYRLEFDMRGSGFTVNETAGEALGNHKLVYRGADSLWYLADADAAATMPVLGITMGAISANRKGEILREGYIGDSSWTWTAGDEIYASTMAGELTQTAPAGAGDIVQVVAMGVSQVMIYFNSDLGNRGTFFSLLLEGETAFVGFDPLKSIFTNYWYCDGTADDVQIQAAIDYVDALGSGSVMIEAGRYYISAKLDMTGMQNITLKGVNSGFDRQLGTVLRAVDGLNDDILELGQGGLANPRLGISIQDIVFDQNAANQTAGDCIEVNTGYILDFRRLLLYSSYVNALDLNTVHESYFEDIVIVASSTDDAVSLLTSNGNMFVKMNVSAANNDGIEVRNSSGNEFHGCDVYQNGRYGMFFVNQSSRNRVIGGNIHTNDSNGITIDSACEDNIIADATIYSNAQGGAGNGIVINNSFGDPSLRNIILGNVITDLQDTPTQGYAIREQTDTNGTLISWNDLRGNVTGSLLLIGDETKAFHNLVDGTQSIGDDVNIPELPLYIKDPDSNIGTHPAVVLPDNADTTVYDQIQIPLEFQQLITAEVIIVPGGTGNLRRSAASNWGKLCSGEAYNAATDSIAAGQVAVDQDDLECIDISTLLTGIASGDQIGFTFTREGSNINDTVNADCYYLGGRIRYV